MPTYIYKDKNARTHQTIPNVSAPIVLSGGATSSGSNIVTVSSTATILPGMPVMCPNIPLGAFVHSIVSSTTVELWLSTFNRTTGIWTTTGANANATATGSNFSIRFYGYNPFCIIELAYALGTWRNTFRTTDRQIGSGGGIGLYDGPGLATIPVYTGDSLGTSSWALYPGTDTYTVTSDEFKPTPVKRHNGELWGVRPFVHTDGSISHIPADPQNSVCLSSLS